MARFEINDIELFHNIITSMSFLFGEINFRIDQYGLTVLGVDASSSVMVINKINNSFFDVFSSEKTLEINLFSGQLEKILRTVERGSITKFNLESTIIEIEIVNQWENKYRLHGLESELYKEISTPKIEHNIEFGIQTSSLHDIIKKIQIISDTIDIESLENQLIFSGRGIYGDVQLILSDDKDSFQEFKQRIEILNKYDIGDLNNILRGGALVSDNCKVYIQSEGPINLVFKENLIEMSYYLAPLIL